MWAKIWFLILQNLSVKKHTEEFLEMLAQSYLYLNPVSFKLIIFFLI